MSSQHREPYKFGVFVGSPKRGLETIRRAIIEAVLNAGHIPDGMELWAANSQPTLQTIGDKLALCDIHVLVLAERYGKILEKHGVSFTEWEYQQSRHAKRPVIAFLLEQEAVDALWEKHPLPDAEKANYNRFREELTENSVCKLYKEPEMLKVDQHVLHAINEVIDGGQLRQPSGWIRAESKVAKLATALQNNAFLMRIMSRVTGFQTAGHRLDKEAQAKRAAAQTFWDAMGNCLKREHYGSIFLESGSSLAYVSEVLEDSWGSNHGWNITTNNALALLQLMLFTNGLVQRVPPVAPDPGDPYGAIFTKACLEAYEDPPSRPRTLYKKEMDAVRELIELLDAGREKRIVLAAASGWDTTHPKIGFRGPHVGSHANMLFKRAIFMADLPVVLFLTRHKVDPNYYEARFKGRLDREPSQAGTRYCYPVFGKELPLARALVDTPLALCVGFNRDASDGTSDLRAIGDGLKSLLSRALAGAGFDMEYASKEFSVNDEWAAGAFMAANERFRKAFPR